MSALLPSEVLSRAADLIEPEGAWAQASNHEADDDANCAMTAIWDVADWSERVACAHLYRALGVENEFAVYCWNDAPDRTQAEVVAALRKASELAKAEGC